MKRILFNSQYEITNDIKNELKSMFGEDVVITQKNISFDTNPNTASVQLRTLAREFDVVGGIFPQQVWISFLKNPIDIPIFFVIYKANKEYDYIYYMNV
ncbi:hypothetical protein [Caldisphaera sp.]|uniref:hypothetical protein n=1 Tax=Caldisphaera sp. TaxID=2060322 RepID=UPI003D10F0B2